MYDEVMHVAMGLRLGASLCHPHECHLCGARVDYRGSHGLLYQRSLGRHPHHMAINDLIKGSLATAKIAAHLEAAGICRADVKRPDGTTVIPWKGGRLLVWDATCPDTLAPSHLQLATREAGAVADQAVRRKMPNYIKLAATHHFVPVAIESTGVFGPQTHAFFHELSRRIKEETGTRIYHQRIAVAIQRGNAAAVLDISPPRYTDPIY